MGSRYFIEQCSVLSHQSLPPPGSFRHPLEQEKRFPASGRDREARAHGPPKPFSLSIINTAVYLPHSQQPCHCPDWLRYRTFALPDSCAAVCPHAWVGCSAGSIEEAASSYPGRGSVTSAGCESTSLPTSIHQHPFNPHSVSHSAAAPLKWPVSILVSSCFCCLFTRGSMASSSA